LCWIIPGHSACTGRCAIFNRRPDTLDLGKEPLNLEFLRFIWTFPAVQRRQLAELETLTHLNVVQLRSDAQAQAWLTALSTA